MRAVRCCKQIKTQLHGRRKLVAAVCAQRAARAACTQKSVALGGVQIVFGSGGAKGPEITGRVECVPADWHPTLIVLENQERPIGRGCTPVWPQTLWTLKTSQCLRAGAESAR